MVFVYSCKKDAVHTKQIKEVKTSDKIKIKTVQVSEGAINNEWTTLAIVMSEAEAKPSFKTGGVIQKTYFKEGQSVSKGQLLATLVMSEIDAQVQQAEEGLLKAQRDFQRVTNLYRDSVATLEQLQNATTGLEVMKKNVEIARFNQQYSQVKAPISGKIVKQIMHEGEVTGPGTPIYAIMGTNNQDWKVRISVNDQIWAKIKKGDHAILTLDAYPGKSFPVFVSDKSLMGGNATSTMDIDLKFKSSPDGLAAGLIGKVNFIEHNKNQKFPLLIPIEALVETNGYSSNVYIVNNKVAKKIPIQIGKIYQDKVEVISGLQKGQVIATIGSSFLEDGEQIDY